MKPSEIFLKAARHIDGGQSDFSCVAVQLVMGSPYTTLKLNPVIDLYRELVLEFYSNYDIGSYIDPDARQHRVFLLLMAWAICESEGC